MARLTFPIACKVCGFVATKGAMTIVNHERVTGHRGWVEVRPEETQDEGMERAEYWIGHYQGERNDG